MGMSYVESAKALSGHFSELSNRISDVIDQLGENDVKKDKKFMKSFELMKSISREVKELTDSLKEEPDIVKDTTFTAYKNKMDAYYVQYRQSIAQIYKTAESKKESFILKLPNEKERENFQKAYINYENSYTEYVKLVKEQAQRSFDIFMDHASYDEKQLNAFASDLKEKNKNLEREKDGSVNLNASCSTFPEALALIHSFRSKKWNSSEYNSIEKSMIDLLNNSKKKDYNMKQLVKDITNVNRCIFRYNRHTNYGAKKLSSLSDQLTRDKKLEAVKKVEDCLDTIFYNNISDEVREYMLNKGDLSYIRRKEEPVKVSQQEAAMSGKTHKKEQKDHLQDKVKNMEKAPVLPKL